MNITAELNPLMPSLDAVIRLINSFEKQGIIIGGVAASLLGKPRLTADVDAVMTLSLDDLPILLQTAEKFELYPRINQVETFARKHHVLLLRHQASGINVDISIGMLPFEHEAVERSIVHQVSELEIRLPTPEDLIIFKAVAHRTKDLQDIQDIIKSQTKLDKGRIKYWVQEFARVLEMPEIWDNIAKWLQ
jgi:hypothetical protein